MYVPAHFSRDDRPQLVELIESNNFGLIISMTPKGIVTSHIPFLVSQYEDKLSLQGHMAKANRHWQHITDNEVLMIFQGPHAYISPTWLDTPGVPTWNYAVVHLYGEANLVKDKDELHQIVLDLSDKHERDRDEPWIPDYDARMLDAIVGFNISVSRIEGKYKLSQNKTHADRVGVVQGLRESTCESDLAIAQLMESL